MLIELSKFTGMPVGALDEGTLIGHVRRALVDPDAGKIAGFLVKENGLFGALKVISTIDVVDVERTALVINSRQNLVDRNEIVRIAKILEYKFNFLGLPARTKEGRMLGRVTDAVVDSITGEILRIYTRFLARSYAFERSRIEEITWQEIILHGDSRKHVKTKAVPAAVDAA